MSREHEVTAEPLSREILWGAAMSFFRNRHERRPLYKKRKAGRNNLMVSDFKRNCEMVRWYLSRIRAIDDNAKAREGE